MNNSVKVYFATNRKLNSGGTIDRPVFTGEFAEAGPATLRFGMAEVGDEGIDYHIAHEVLGDAPILGSKEMFDRLQIKMIDHQRDTVFFIPGFNTTFDEALISAATIKRNFSSSARGPGINVVVFSWPSNGRIIPYLDYWSDREEAAQSAPALARGLIKFSDFLRQMSLTNSCEHNIHIIAHSMGVWVLRNAVQYIMTRFTNNDMGRLVDQVLLMAGDEDADALSYDKKLRPLTRLAKGITVYSNSNDPALGISNWTKNNPARIGQDGPEMMDGLPARIVSVDCTEVITGDSHSYLFDDPGVINDMADVLRGDRATDINDRVWSLQTKQYTLI